jgi:hypothetical protein
MQSLRRSPCTSARRSPARAINSRISRSRAERYAPTTATMSASAARSTGRFGSCSRCRARIRHDIPASSPRAASGRSRSSATSNSSGTRCPPACPAATARTTIPRTAVSTALIRRAPRTGGTPGPRAQSPQPQAHRHPRPAGQRAPATSLTARSAQPPPARTGPTGRTSAGTTRSNPRTPSLLTPRHPGRTAPAATTNPRLPRRPGPHPEPSSTSPRTATSLGKPASLIARSRAELHEQLPASGAGHCHSRRPYLVLQGMMRRKEQS